MIHSKKILSLFLAVHILLGMAGAALAQEPRAEGALVIGYAELAETCSPFYMESGSGMDAANAFIGGRLMVTDRAGGIVYDGIAGETIACQGTDYTYYGLADLSVARNEATDTTVYTARLREDVKFSDGTPMTADDLIFTYYVLLDPSYTGASTLSSYDIMGLKAYRTQIPEATQQKYDALAKDIYTAGADHVWAEGDAWTQEQQEALWAGLKAEWMADMQAIINYCVDNFNTEEYAAFIEATPEEIRADARLGNVFGMMLWGFTTYDAGVLIAPDSGMAWNLVEGIYPTLEDCYEEAAAKYGYDPDRFFSAEMAGLEDTPTLAAAQAALYTGAGGGGSGSGGRRAQYYRHTKAG